MAMRVARDFGANVDHALMRDFDVPLYNGHVETAQGIPTGAKTFRDRLLASDAFIVSSPEYNASSASDPSQHADLTEESHLVVEEVLFDNLAVLPSRNRTEFELEGFPRRVVYRAIQALPRADHFSFPPGDRARPITGAEHHPVRIVVEVILD
jgi:hypothetical protein